jgi:hypothetical protein
MTNTMGRPSARMNRSGSGVAILPEMHGFCSLKWVPSLHIFCPLAILYFEEQPCAAAAAVY